jgi:hypothetical protein
MNHNNQERTDELKSMISIVSRMFATVAIGVWALTAQAQSVKPDPLPSWNDSPTKRAIIEFVERVITPGHKDFVPEAERLATFDNDGTLWCEHPVVQFAFVADRLKQMSSQHPEWKNNPAVQAMLHDDIAYFMKVGEHALVELIALTHAGMTRDEFHTLAADFFKTARHPRYGVPYTEVAYLPMLELLAYLRANSFQTWICSGGGAEFMRVISREVYGIPPEQVIGSMGGFEFQVRDGLGVLVKTPKLMLNNDKAGKPVGIALQTGRTPIFAAGNVRTGGDIAHLTFAHGNPRANLQLLVNHDDAEREFAYVEKDNASLDAARQQGWTVVSIKNDWKRLFAFEK